MASLDESDSPNSTGSIVQLVILITPQTVHVCLEYELRTRFHMLDALPQGEQQYLQLANPIMDTDAARAILDGGAPITLWDSCMTIAVCNYLNAVPMVSAWALGQWHAALEKSYRQADSTWAKAFQWSRDNAKLLSDLRITYGDPIMQCARHNAATCIPHLFLPEDKVYVQKCHLKPMWDDQEYLVHWYKLIQQISRHNAITPRVQQLEVNGYQLSIPPEQYHRVQQTDKSLQWLCTRVPFLASTNFPWDGVAVAGGSIVSALTDRGSIKDIDLFVYGSNVHLRCKQLAQWLENWFQEHWIPHWWTVYGSIVQVHVAGQGYRSVQLMQTEHYTPVEVVRSFDYDYVQCWYRDGMFHCTYDCLLALSSRTVHVIRADSRRAWGRLYKTLKKGFGIANTVYHESISQIIEDYSTADGLLEYIRNTCSREAKAELLSHVGAPHEHLEWDENALLLHRRNTVVLPQSAKPADYVPHFRLFESRAFSIGCLSIETPLEDYTWNRKFDVEAHVCYIGTQVVTYKWQNTMVSRTPITDDYWWVRDADNEKMYIKMFDCSDTVDTLRRILLSPNNSVTLRATDRAILSYARWDVSRITFNVTSKVEVVCALTHQTSTLGKHWPTSNPLPDLLNKDYHIQVFFAFYGLIINKRTRELKPRLEAKKIIVWPRNFWHNTWVYPSAPVPYTRRYEHYEDWHQLRATQHSTISKFIGVSDTV